MGAAETKSGHWGALISNHHIAKRGNGHKKAQNHKNNFAFVPFVPFCGGSHCVCLELSCSAGSPFRRAQRLTASAEPSDPSALYRAEAAEHSVMVEAMFPDHPSKKRVVSHRACR